ncbi:MAG: SEC-C domain-containing protein [Armatimonadetes bacterium]|nr:SEC-C domain-containing protein [Armatimonadota bacterium]
MNLLRKLFDNNEREVSRLRSVVDKINALEPEFEAIPTEALAEKTAEFKALIEERRQRIPKPEVNEAEFSPNGPNPLDDYRKELRQAEQDALDEILPQAFALVREAAKRTIGLRHYDVQMIGGMVLHQGRIAEMRTGEGKTLVATLPLYLNALLGRGTHLVTHNDYLAKRDAIWNGPIYHTLGLTVGVLQSTQSSSPEGYRPAYTYDPAYEPEDPRLQYARKVPRKDAYQCDILYGIHSEFGFDYLYDNMVHSLEEMTQRDLYFCVVDEVDSILIDEARTPLIISGMPEESTDQYYAVDQVVAVLTPEEHFTVDEKARTAMLTEAGTERVEKGLNVENIAEDVTLMHHIGAALKARYAYKRDVDYVVKDGEVIIVDEQTGRLMFGRRYQDGLHQALEAKEGCPIEAETQTIASVTYQNYMRLYQKIGGMTGTAKTEEAEFRKIYGMDVVTIPTNKPMIRQDFPDVVYKTEDQKFRGVVREILQMHALGRPVLVGTRTIEVSERLSERLLNERLQLLALITTLQYRLWADKDLSKEEKAQISAQLNSPFGDLWVAKLTGAAKALGASPDPFDETNLREFAEILEITGQEERLKEVMKTGIEHKVLNAKFHEREAEIIADAGRPEAVTIATNMAGRGVDILLGGNPAHYEDAREKGDHVREVGGLHIIGSERHEARRIDNQLRGRAGRQGDPGSSRFYLSLDDYIWRLFGDKGRGILQATWDEGEPIAAGLLSKAIERAQKKVEENNFAIRKHVLEYDDVMNKQREVIYGTRRRVLEGADIHESIKDHIARIVENAVMLHTGEAPKETWDLEALYNNLNEVFPLAWYAEPKELEGKSAEQLTDWLTEIGQNALTAREEEIDSQAGPGSFREIERQVMLMQIDQKWISHLQAIDYLREGINLRAYAQIDPLVAFRKEAFEYFQELQNNIQRDVVALMFRLQIAPPPVEYTPLEANGDGDGNGYVEEYDGNGHAEAPRSTPVRNLLSNRKSRQAPVSSGPKAGRNDPCPCGSGKKFKKCCGA